MTTTPTISFTAILLISLFVLGGCYQNPHKTQVHNPRVDLDSLPECCCSNLVPIYETPPCIPLKNEANVRLPEKIKAYAVNRYIDPANPRIMHERHVMYRIEEDSTWRLTTDESRQILIGNTVTDGNLNYNPLLMEKELALELHRQRLINETLQTHSDILIDTSAGLNKENEVLLERSDQLRKALEEQAKMIAELNSRLNL